MELMLLSLCDCRSAGHVYPDPWAILLPHCWLMFQLCEPNWSQLAIVPLTGKALPIEKFLNVGTLRNSWNSDVHEGGVVR